jgi:spore germination protein
MSVDYGVAPLMLVSSLDETGQGTPEITHALFNSQELQHTLIDNIITEVTIKGYYGVYFGFQYILKEDLQNYTDFIILATQRLHLSGYISGVVLLPSTFGYVQGEITNPTYYREIGQWVDEVTLLSYQWATSYIPDAYQTTYTYITEYLNAVIELIPPEKIYLGISRIAYDWELPYVEGESFVSSLTTPGALALANQYDSEIYFDETTQTPYFRYRLVDTDHIVWFKDARYTNSMLQLVYDYGLGGISVWNIMFFYRIWLLINSQFDIIKA